MLTKDSYKITIINLPKSKISYRNKWKQIIIYYNYYNYFNILCYNPTASWKKPLMTLI